MVVVPCLAVGRQFNAERRLLRAGSLLARAPVNSNTAFRQGRLPSTASPTRLSWYSDYSLDLRTMWTSEYSHSVLSDTDTTFKYLYHCIPLLYGVGEMMIIQMIKSPNLSSSPRLTQPLLISHKLFFKAMYQRQLSSTIPTKTSSPPSTTTSTKI